MKIQKIMQQTTKPNFGAGITNLYSNFDGTYIPQKYNHDSVCNHSPQVNKDEFQGTMEKTWELFWKLKGDGKESKFNFAITTGRNLNEFNYFLNKLRSQDLWIPFPDKVITGNGEDEFYSNIKDEKEFYNGGQPAFTKENVNKEKREFFKENNWNFDNIISNFKNIFNNIPNDNVVTFKDKEQKLTDAIKDHLNITDTESISLLKELQQGEHNEQSVRKVLEEKSKAEITTEKEKELYDWYMGQLAQLVHQATSKHALIEDVQTLRSTNEYQDGISLQTALETKGLTKDDDFLAIADNGKLGIRIGISNKHASYYDDAIKFYQNNDNGKNTVLNVRNDGFVDKELEIKPLNASKLSDAKKQLDNITKNKTNDILVVAGSDINDIEMLTLNNYYSTNEKGIPNSSAALEYFNNIPLVSIFVDNRTEAERANKESTLSKLLENNKYANYDGRLRFIHVDPKDANKPHSLDEAVKMAVASYAKVNEEFKNNLSPEMKEIIDKYEFSYPTDEKINDEFNTLIDPNYPNIKILNKELSNIGKFADDILSINNAKNIDEIALDKESKIDLKDRTPIVEALASMLVSYKLIEKMDKELVTKHLQLHLEQITDSPKVTKEQKTKFIKRMIEDKKVLNAPENPKKFLEQFKKQPVDPIVKTTWEKVVEWTKKFVKTKTGKATVAAVGLAAIGAGVVIANNKNDTKNHTQRTRRW